MRKTTKDLWYEIKTNIWFEVIGWILYDYKGERYLQTHDREFHYDNKWNIWKEQIHYSINHTIREQENLTIEEMLKEELKVPSNKLRMYDRYTEEEDIGEDTVAWPGPSRMR